MYVSSPASFKAVDINSNANRCGISTTGGIYYGDSNNNWVKLSGYATDCAIADDGTFMVIGGSGTLYQWTGSAWNDLGITGNKKNYNY